MTNLNVNDYILWQHRDSRNIHINQITAIYDQGYQIKITNMLGFTYSEEIIMSFKKPTPFMLLFL